MENRKFQLRRTGRKSLLLVEFPIFITRYDEVQSVNIFCNVTGIRIYVTNWALSYEKKVKVEVKEKSAVGVDSLLNIETIKYCGTTKYEVDAYSTALLEDQKNQFYQSIPYHVTELFENVVISGSLLVSSLLCAYLVVDTGSLTSGQYVFFAAYMLQLYSPMNRLSGIYR